MKKCHIILIRCQEDIKKATLLVLNQNIKMIVIIGFSFDDKYGF